jgi:aminotransferase
MCDIEQFGYPDDVSFATRLVKDVGLAVVPGSSFYSDPADGAQQVRFAFPKQASTLQRAAERLQSVAALR